MPQEQKKSHYIGQHLAFLKLTAQLNISREEEK